MKENQTLVIVGDTHSQHQKIEAVLDWCEKEFTNPYYVWLGDIMDSRLDNHEHNYPPYSDPQAAFELVEYEVLMGHGVLLQSNHQDKLKRWISHDIAGTKPNPVTVNYGLDHTINQFINHLTIEEKVELHDWLSLLPHHVVIQGYDQQHDAVISFLCSHAYFNTAVNIQNPSKKHIQEALYGCMDSNNKRLDWWSSDEPLSFYGLPAIRIAGHYHVLSAGRHQRVIDTGCGNTGGSLCIHVPAYGLYKEF